VRRGYADVVSKPGDGTGPDAACAACGSSDLAPHLRVSGAAGAEGLIPTTDRFGSALADIVRCNSCGHMQLARMPSEAQLAAAYAEAASDDYVEEETGQRATASADLARVERWTPGRRLLDVGCWVGFLMAQARDRGWEVEGIEPSEFASRRARERLGLDVQTTDLFDARLEPGAFDAVVLGDVLEHFPRPADVLDRVAFTLAPDGVVFLTLPDAGSRVARVMGARWWSVIPTHVQYFTRGSLATLLRRRGFEPLYIGTAPKAFSVRYYLGRLSGYSHGIADAAVGGAEAVGVADRLWAPDFRDRMAVVARRAG